MYYFIIFWLLFLYSLFGFFRGPLWDLVGHPRDMGLQTLALYALKRRKEDVKLPHWPQPLPPTSQLLLFWYYLYGNVYTWSWYKSSLPPFNHFIPILSFSLSLFWWILYLIWHLWVDRLFNSFRLIWRKKHILIPCDVFFFLIPCDVSWSGLASLFICTM